jgi:hypothetical protein
VQLPDGTEPITATPQPQLEPTQTQHQASTQKTDEEKNTETK